MSQDASFHWPSLRRASLIARRDYMGYVKTVGFWVSFCLPFIVIALALLASNFNLSEKITPIRYEAILDETGQHAAQIKARHDRQQIAIERQHYQNLSENLPPEIGEKILQEYDRDGHAAVTQFMGASNLGGMPNISAPTPKLIIIEAPADNLDDIKPYLTGQKTLQFQGEAVALDGLLYLKQEAESGRVSGQYWSANIHSQDLPNITRDYFQDQNAIAYLSTGGLTLDGYKKARRGNSQIAVFDPTKTSESGASQAVTIADQIPYMIAAGMTMFLWLSIFSGSYMLLTSMLEEKLNKLLEMMLSTIQFSEVVLGKLIGIAALTLTSMFPYFLLGAGTIIGFLVFGTSEMALGVKNALTPQLIGFFTLYLVLGYIFYGALFIAIGSLATSMQDAQTLTAPLMLILTASVMIVPIGLSTPDADIVRWASWFPLSAPFAAIIRVPSQPPLWELILPAVIVFALTVLIIFLGGKAFRQGVFGGFSLKHSLAVLFRLKKPHDMRPS